MKKIRTWSDYNYAKINNAGHSTLEQDTFLSEQLKTKHRDKALNEFIELHMLVVHKLCKSYTWSNLDYDDLVQYGVEGLIAAAEIYDPSKGYKYHTICYHYVLGRLRRALEHYNNLIKIPAHLNLAKLRINHLDEDKDYTDEYLMQFVDDRYSLKDLKRALEIKKLYKTDDLELIIDKADDSIKDFEIKACIEGIVSKLTNIEQKCIELKFGLAGNKTHYYYEIDALLKIDSEHIITKVLIRFRADPEMEILREYLK